MSNEIYKILALVSILISFVLMNIAFWFMNDNAPLLYFALTFSFASAAFEQRVKRN